MKKKITPPDGMKNHVQATAVVLKHLRAGNTILIDGKPATVVLIDAEAEEVNGVNIGALADSEDPKSFRIQPVMATKQMMYDHNFRLDNVSGYLKHETGFMTINEDLDFITVPPLHISFALKPAHWHQIQNIYFYLKGEELTRKNLVIT